MFFEDKVTEIFCLADEFCKFFDAQQENSMLEAPQDGKRRCFKHYYLHYICKHCKHMFPKTVSYNRFVELEKEVLLLVPIPDTNKFQYMDTRFKVRLKASSGIDCYDRIINHLRNRPDVDKRSQFPSAKSTNFTFE